MLKYVPQLAEYDGGNGVCRYLRRNLCSVYDSRPLVCNAAAMYDKFFKDTMTEAEFIAANMEACRKIKEMMKN
jgi:Fe-S-cluster containining protein